MCGFVAIHDREQAPVSESTLRKMTDVIAHRGPDDAGTYRRHGIALGFRRLSILDTSAAGSQPMQSPCGRYVLAFNGEIFNYRELRQELALLGHTFQSTGDTEVLLAAWVQWGHGCLPKLNGMWAFVVWDNLTRTLCGSRDRFGIKPLYWYRSGRLTAFVSEIKSLRDSGFARLEADLGVVSRMIFDDKIDTGERTFYHGVQRVPAGYRFELASDGTLHFHSYWSLTEAAAAQHVSVDGMADQFAEIFEDAVRLQMRSDVEIGVLLSGGLDSTSIACAMSRQLRSTDGPGKVSALSYLSPDFDERQLIEATIRQTSAKWIKTSMDASVLWGSLRQHAWHQDEPVHSMTSVVSFHLLASARAHGMKVVLNGQGADEMLAGYPHFIPVYWFELLRRGRWRELLASVAARRRVDPEHWHLWLSQAIRQAVTHVRWMLPGAESLSARQRASRVRAHPLASPELKRHWALEPYSSLHSVADTTRSAIEHAHLPLYLRVEDRNSMAHGIELRVPFLDHRLVTLAFAIDARDKLKGGLTKAVLRDAMRARIPESVRRRVDKFGFPTSVDQWFRGPLFGPMQDLLRSRSVADSGLWNTPAVETLLARHARGEINAGPSLFSVAQLSLWTDLNRTPEIYPSRSGSVLRADAVGSR